MCDVKGIYVLMHIAVGFTQVIVWLITNYIDMEIRLVHFHSLVKYTVSLSQHFDKYFLRERFNFY